LIEGDLGKFNSFKERIDKQTIYSAMFSINHFKGFSLMRTNTIDETAFMVCNMAYKIGKDKDKNPYFQNKMEKMVEENSNLNNGKVVETVVEAEEEEGLGTGGAEGTGGTGGTGAKDYCAVIKKVKKDNITPENIGEIMLCQIPGVSSVSAIAILRQFKTLPELIKAIKEDATCLTGVSTTDAKGKTRKISKTTIETIVKYLS
jgi:ERCC4-type nuclease